MHTIETMGALVAECKFDNWDIVLRLDDNRPYLQVRFESPDNYDESNVYIQHGRKWMLSYHMTDDEIVSTALKAVLTAVEHEARERFTWRGQPIYRPHYDIHKLHALSSANAVCMRD